MNLKLLIGADKQPLRHVLPLKELMRGTSHGQIENAAFLTTKHETGMSYKTHIVSL